MRLIAFSLLVTVGLIAAETPAPSSIPPPQTAGSGGGSKAQDTPVKQKGLFDEVPVVQAATLHMQTLDQVPANVSVITASDIRNFGYRTLGDALDGVRGFYMTNDQIYGYAGTRGISVPGDYNSRFLVMINGHPMTDNIYNSNGFFGQDFGLDMDLVERIEIIRGPSSALYGSNGMLANINIVTKSPVDHERVRVSTEMDSLGERKTIVSSSMDLGHGANLLISGSIFNYGSRDFFVSQYNTPETNSGIARGGNQKGYHSFANLIWRDWRITTLFNSRDNRPPLTWAPDALFNVQGNRVTDGRNFAEAAYTHNLANSSTVRWSLSYDSYRYLDRSYYAGDNGDIDGRTINKGDWITSQLSYSIPVAKKGTFTFGGVGRYELRTLQTYTFVSPTPATEVDLNNPDRTMGAFSQVEYELSSKVRVLGGLRYDFSRNYNRYLSPQAALVYQMTPRTTHKLVYGRPYRNPSAFEQYYGDSASYTASGGLRQERAQAVEYSLERKVAGRLSAIANVYQYRINDLIQANALENGFQQYVNGENYRSTGVEFELSGVVRERVQLSGSITRQKAVSGVNRDWIANSPEHMGKLRAATPIFKNRLTISSMLNYIGERGTRDGGTVKGFALVDFTATTNHLHRQFDIQFGLRNALDKSYLHPIALAIDRMPGDGRTAYVKLLWFME